MRVLGGGAYGLRPSGFSGLVRGLIASALLKILRAGVDAADMAGMGWDEGCG